MYFSSARYYVLTLYSYLGLDPIAILRNYADIFVSWCSSVDNMLLVSTPCNVCWDAVSFVIICSIFVCAAYSVEMPVYFVGELSLDEPAILVVLLTVHAKLRILFLMDWQYCCDKYVMYFNKKILCFYIARTEVELGADSVARSVYSVLHVLQL